MADELYISERKALTILMQDGDFAESQARIVLAHSRKQAYEGATMYPLAYIAKRAADNASRDDGE